MAAGSPERSRLVHPAIDRGETERDRRADRPQAQAQQAGEPKPIHRVDDVATGERSQRVKHIEKRTTRGELVAQLAQQVVAIR